MATARRPLIILAIVSVVLAAIAGASLLFLQTTAGRDFVATRGLKALGDAIGSDIGAGKIGGDWPDHIVLDDVTLRDTQGVWLSVDRLTVDWHAAALLRGRVDIDALRAGTVHVSRQPVSSGGGGAFDPSKIRGALARVYLENLAIDVVRLDEPVLGRAGAVAVRGAVKHGADGPVVTLALDRQDAAGTAAFTMSLPSGALALNAQAAIAGVTLDSAIAMDQRSNQLSGTVKLACGDGTPCLIWSGGRLGAVTVDAEMAGTLSAPRATAAVRVADLADGERSLAALTGKATIAPAAGGLAVRGEGAAQGLKSAVPELASIVDDAGTWSLDGETAGRTFTVTAFTLRAGDTAATISGTADAGVLRGVRGTVSVHRVGRLFGMTDTASDAEIAVALDRLTFAPFAAAGQVTAEVRNAPPGMSLAPLAAGNLRLASPATFRNGRLTFPAVTGTFGSSSFRGASAWGPGARGLDHDTTSLTANVPAGAVPWIAAPLQVQARLTGGLDALKADLTADTTGVSLAGAPVADAKAVVEATQEHGLWRGNARMEGRWRDQPLNLASDFAQEAEATLALTDTRVNLLAIPLAGSLKVNMDSGILTGALAGKSPDLTPLTGLLGLPATGSGDLAAAFTANTGQRVTLNLAAGRLKGASLAADALTAQAIVDDAWGAPQLTLRVKATDGAILGRPIAQATITADGPFSALAVRIQAAGAGVRKFALDTAATVTLNDEVTVELGRLALTDGGIAATLAAPVRFVYSPATVSLAPARIAINGGEATAQFTLDRRADHVTGEIKLAKVVLGEAADLPGAAQTTVDAAVTVSGAATAADADITLAAHYVAADAGADVRAKASARLRQGRATIAASASGLSDEDAVLKADIPARLDLTGPRLTLDMSAPITGALTWHGDINPLWRLLALDQHLLAGQADVDVTATGTLEQPAVTGGVKLSNAGYENLASGTVLRNLNADVSATSGSAMTIRLSAADTGGGRVSAQGTMTLDRARGRWSVDASGDLTAFHILRRDDVTAAATGHITYKGPVLAGTLAGRLQVVRSEMRIGASYVPEIPLLRAASLGEPPVPGQPSTVQLDITLAIADVLRIEGKGLEAFWRGQLTARGGLNNPDVSGTLTLARGSFTFLGRAFDLDTGSVTFTGGGKIDPELALSASRQSGDVTATVTITGRASQPQITLSSVPVMPQDEVLAQLLFRKGSTQLGPLESLQLASAAADLSGLSQGGLSGMLRRTFGIDVVGFGGQSGDAVVLGHQLTSALYVGVEQSIGTANQHQIVVEWRLTPSLALQSTTTSQTGADLGVIWRKNY